MTAVAYPVKVAVTLNDRVARVNENDFVPLQLAIFAYPVGVQDFHVRELPACALFSDPLDAFSCSDLVLTHVMGTPAAHIPGSPEASPAHLYTGNNYALFRLVTKRTCTVDTCGASYLCDRALFSPFLEPFPSELTDVSGVRVLPCVSYIAVK